MRCTPRRAPCCPLGRASSCYCWAWAWCSRCTPPLALYRLPHYRLSLAARTCSSQALRTDQWLYVEYDRGLPPELYDTVADPAQQVNLAEAREHAATRQELSQRLADLRREYA